MKKILLACVLATVMALTMIPVAVQAAPQEGLMSTWYQVMNDDGEPHVDHGGPIGGLMGDLEDPDYTIMVGQVMVPTFEIKGGDIQTGFDFGAVGFSEGMETKGQDGGTDINDVYIRFEGTITAPETGDYEFSSNRCDNACVIDIDGNVVFEFWVGGDWRDEARPEVVEGNGPIHMEAGVAYPITVYFVEQGGGTVLAMDVSVNGADPVKMSTLGFTFSYDPDAKPTPEPTVEPTPTPEVTKTPVTQAPATDAPATTAPVTTAPATTAPATSAPATSAPAATTPAGTDAPAEGGFPIWIIAVIALAVVAIVVVVIVVAKKKK